VKQSLNQSGGGTAPRTVRIVSARNGSGAGG